MPQKGGGGGRRERKKKGKDLLWINQVPTRKSKAAQNLVTSRGLQEERGWKQAGRRGSRSQAILRMLSSWLLTEHIHLVLFIYGQGTVRHLGKN